MDKGDTKKDKSKVVHTVNYSENIGEKPQKSTISTDNLWKLAQSIQETLPNVNGDASPRPESSPRN